jgi:hypothetical protein
VNKNRFRQRGAPAHQPTERPVFPIKQAHKLKRNLTAFVLYSPFLIRPITSFDSAPLVFDSKCFLRFNHKALPDDPYWIQSITDIQVGLVCRPRSLIKPMCTSPHIIVLFRSVVVMIWSPKRVFIMCDEPLNKLSG